jgi:hypothetical protein
MSLRRGDVADAAVAVLKVVPTHKVVLPGAGIVKCGEAARLEFGTVLRSHEERFDKGALGKTSVALYRTAHGFDLLNSRSYSNSASVMEWQREALA